MSVVYLLAIESVANGRNPTTTSTSKYLSSYLLPKDPYVSVFKVLSLHLYKRMPIIRRTPLDTGFRISL